MDVYTGLSQIPNRLFFSWYKCKVKTDLITGQGWPEKHDINAVHKKKSPLFKCSRMRLWECLLVREAIFWDLVTCKSSLDNPWTLEGRDQIFRPNSRLFLMDSRLNVRLKGKRWSWDTAGSRQQSSANKPAPEMPSASPFSAWKAPLSKTERARKPRKVPQLLIISHLPRGAKYKYRIAL